jgi:hypothetical protein
MKLQPEPKILEKALKNKITQSDSEKFKFDFSSNLELNKASVSQSIKMS